MRSIFNLTHYSIYEYIVFKLLALDAALKFAENTEKVISCIADNPFMYPVYHDEEIAKKGYRYSVVGNYLLFYIVN